MNLEKCIICPRECNVNRYKNIGFCNSNSNIKIAKFYLHQWEEPCISGKYGSGTVFFSNCNLKCVYCQNYEISTLGKGIEITIDELCNIFLTLQEQGATNINLVTPSHYIYQIKIALIKSKEKGLNIPIVYNTSGYDSVDSLKELDGLIDIYLTDMKYYDNFYAIKYSKANNYFNVCKNALKEMYRQVGKNKFNNNIMTKGIIVRHLLLPDLSSDTKKILKYLYKTYKNNIYISIMNQYTPVENVKNIRELNRKVTNDEYNNIINFAINLGIENAFIQEGDTAKESFIPNFDLKNLKKDISQIKEIK